MKVKQILGKFEHATRLAYINSVTHINDSVLIVEYPKSGGTWLAQLVSGSLELPFPRNKYPILKRAVYHSHYQPKFIIHKNKHIIWLLRDGRDIMVSSYFHHLVWNDKNKKDPKLVSYYRNKLKFKDYSDIENNLARYIEFLFEDNPSKFVFFNHPGNWKDFNEKWQTAMNNQKNITLIKYEDMLKDTYGEIQKLLKAAVPQINVDPVHLKKVVNTYSFENQTKRKPGDENTNSFLRKGISGDWKNYFNDEAKEVFKKYAGQMLIDMNYESDLKW
ncbi:MAG: sulfotransferase domain-containing protein [Bacteroidia bacterium]|nr:sulfotransferase domain-containing protein [Bacteroidia bacterium]NND25716.1 hypothetical protein [Flavobacteriaceae bacterium]MBT8279218.1 sulfotransferase domain-containing protein [Bacteroidia bacterium]NNK59754.1 hypothetical protein [Flavobacteriaceae bacterium]NNL32018.1 hypothetical protein [Flavobacteriaceae bacterium]